MPIKLTNGNFLKLLFCTFDKTFFMKNLLFIAFLFLSCSMFSQFGQQQNGYNNGARGGGFNNQINQHREDPKKIEPLTDDEIIKKMIAEVKIDELQQLMVQEILNSTPHKTVAKDQESAEKMLAERESMDKKLKKVLTEEQMIKWQATRSKPLDEKKSESRKERKEREKKESEALEKLK